MFGHLIVFEHIPGAGMGACGFPLPLYGQVQLLTEFAHPADLSGRYTNHQSVGRDILINDRSCTNEGVFTNSYAAYDGAIGPQSCAFFDQGVTVFVFALYEGTGIVDVGEYHAGAAENPLFDVDVVVDGDVVLNFAVVTDGDLVANEHVLAHGDVLSDSGATAYVHEVPDSGTFADLGTFVYYGAGVDRYRHRSRLFLVEMGAAP